ncbi:polysaccharide biosynthesis protein [Niallia circulans]|uniref:Polysaccharide biosynthesis protein n=1 Tax=Niallia circulans TaxID=1397 RepID=A0A553SIL6_NIACI|nr:PssD/Cps14F family polysaccharide biosynthesis glycosyltransferase [Niallia circulans]TRZ36826.1 polysaccharide biosynthesis protein [Niallia circulans]
MKTKKKVCLISSSGGHLSQLKQLIPIVDEEEFFLITEKNESTIDLIEKYPTFYLKQQDRRNKLIIFILLFNILKSLLILIKNRPKYIITTGAGVVIPFCLLGKVMGAKVLFIESFAKVNTPTITGRVVYKFADEFFIQWPNLKKYYPKAKYRGTIY